MTRSIRAARPLLAAFAMVAAVAVLVPAAPIRVPSFQAKAPVAGAVLVVALAPVLM